MKLHMHNGELYVDDGSETLKRVEGIITSNQQLHGIKPPPWKLKDDPIAVTCTVEILPDGHTESVAKLGFPLNRSDFEAELQSLRERVLQETRQLLGIVYDAPVIPWDGDPLVQPTDQAVVALMRLRKQKDGQL